MKNPEQENIRTHFNESVLRLIARDHAQGNLAWQFAADLYEFFIAMDQYNKTKPVVESAISMLAHDRLNDWLIENRRTGMIAKAYHDAAVYSGKGKENANTNALIGPPEITSGIIVQYGEQYFSSVYVAGRKNGFMRIISKSGEMGDFIFGREKDPDPATFGPIPLFTRAPL